MSLEILEPLLEKFSIEGDARETLQDIVTTSSPKSTDFFQKVLAFQRANSVENSFFPELVNALQKAPKSKKPSNKSAAPSKKTAAKKRRSSSTKSLSVVGIGEKGVTVSLEVEIPWYVVMSRASDELSEILADIFVGGETGNSSTPESSAPAEKVNSVPLTESVASAAEVVEPVVSDDSEVDAYRKAFAGPEPEGLWEKILYYGSVAGTLTITELSDKCSAPLVDVRDYLLYQYDSRYVLVSVDQENVSIKSKIDSMDDQGN